MKTNKSFSLIIEGFILFIISACLNPVLPTPTQTPLPTPCPPPSPDLYALPPMLPANYVADWSTLTEQQALSLLVGQVERWSDYEDITLDDNTSYRITITLITPDLRRAAYVMEAVHRRQPQAILERFAQLETDRPDRANLLFLVTVAAAGAGLTGERAAIVIAPNNLILFDRQRQPVNFSTSEGAFLTNFNVVNGPFAAYIAYPLMNAQCGLNVDALAEPSITLSLKEVIIAGKPFNNKVWTITLAPLISIALPTLAPNPPGPGGTGVAYLEPKTIPPTPNPGDNNFLVMDNYWKDLAKFIWSKLSGTNSR